MDAVRLSANQEQERPHRADTAGSLWYVNSQHHYRYPLTVKAVGVDHSHPSVPVYDMTEKPPPKPALVELAQPEKLSNVLADDKYDCLPCRLTGKPDQRVSPLRCCSSC